MKTNTDLIMLIVSIIGLVNSLVIVPVVKTLSYLIKRVSYLEGHLKIKE